MDALQTQKDITDLNVSLIEISREYREARVNYSKHKYELNRLLAERINVYRQEKKNVGVDFAILMALEDKAFDKRDQFKEAYYGMEYNQALYKGKDREFNAIQSQIMSLQALMKYFKENDTYG